MNKHITSSGAAPSTGARAGGRMGSLGRIAACFLAGALFGALPCALYSHAYFRDDVQAKFMPMLVALGAAFRHGEWVPLTLQSWAGGNIVAEYQYGIFNPLSLASYAAISLIGNMAVGIACLVAFYDGMLAAGTYVLARRCGADRPWALIAAAAFVTNNFIYYWLASPWITGLISFAWLVWALAFLLEAGRSRFRWLLATLAMALTIDAGWQYGAPVLGIMTLILAGGDVVRGDRRAAAARLLALAAAGLLTLCTLLPGLASSVMSDQPSGIANTSFLVPNLYGVLALSSPDYRGFMPIFGGRHDIWAPIFYAGWYLLPLLPLIAWRRLSLSRPMLWSLGLFGAIMLLATQGPEQLGLVRWSFRFVPYFQLAVVLMVSLAASDAGFAAPSRRRVAAALGLVALSAVGAWQAHPEGWAGEALLGAIMAGVTLYIALFPATRIVMVVTATLCLFLVTRAWYPVNLNVPEWPVSSAVTSIVDLEAVPSSYSLYLGTLFEPDFGRQTAGQVGLVHGRAAINGYSTYRHRGLAAALCMGTAGDTCDKAGPALMQPDPATGMPLGDLLRVDRLIVQKGQPFPTPGFPWRTTDETETSATYERDAPADRPPGSVAWATPGMTLKETIAATPTEERIDVTAPGTAGERRILFARAFWPGYAATLDGATLAVKPYRDLLVAVDMPAGVTAGTLVLRYSPPFATAGAIAAALALLLMFLVWGFGPGRLFRAA